MYYKATVNSSVKGVETLLHGNLVSNLDKK
jgi:hypothetical protein